ncbi:hypothetical protein [Streptomyces prunicolor]
MTETVVPRIKIDVLVGPLARGVAFFVVDLVQPVERGSLVRVASLLALTTCRIAIANGVRVGASVLPGAVAVLEEAAHPTDELSRQRARLLTHAGSLLTNGPLA